MSLCIKCALLLVTGVFASAQSAYVHPFIPVKTGNKWEYRSFHSSSNPTSMTTTQGSGIIKMEILNDTTIKVQVIDTSSNTPAQAGDSIQIHDTTYTTSLRDSSVDEAMNLFLIDSMFFGDTTGNKTFLSGPLVYVDSSAFCKVEYQKDTLFLQKIVDNYSDPCCGNYLSYSTRKYVQKYGLLTCNSDTRSFMNGYSGSFFLISFNGAPVDTSAFGFLNDVSQSEMEKLYPAYAVHPSGVVEHHGQRQSFSNPFFSFKQVSGGVEASFSAPHAYTLTVTSTSGKVVRVIHGDAGAQRILFVKKDLGAGVYLLNMTSGTTAVRTKIHVW